MSELTITCARNGPYTLRGPVTIVDPRGEEIHVADGEVAKLCRCGGSATKPFCDDTHARIGFRTPEPAARQRS